MSYFQISIFITDISVAAQFISVVHIDIGPKIYITLSFVQFVTLPVGIELRLIYRLNFVAFEI